MITQQHDVVLAFGSNLGDRAATIRAAQQVLQRSEGIEMFRASSLRETIALTDHGLDVDAPRYLNGVATLRTSLDPLALLELVRGIENTFGRERHEHWGDRTLDIDIITYGGKVVHEPDLTVPHKHAHERDFVLAPWLELDPDAVLIGHGRVAALLDALGDSTTAYAESTEGVVR